MVLVVLLGVVAPGDRRFVAIFGWISLIGLDLDSVKKLARCAGPTAA